MIPPTICAASSLLHFSEKIGLSDSSKLSKISAKMDRVIRHWKEDKKFNRIKNVCLQMFSINYQVEKNTYVQIVAFEMQKQTNVL